MLGFHKKDPKNIEEASAIITHLDVYGQAQMDAQNVRNIWALPAKDDLKWTIKKVQEEVCKLVQEIKRLRTGMEQRQSAEDNKARIQQQSQPNSIEWNNCFRMIDRANGLCYSCHFHGL